MVVFHDWVGTIFGMFFVLLGFTLFVFMLLPSNKRLLEASRGVDAVVRVVIVDDGVIDIASARRGRAGYAGGGSTS
jgi:hypothetical protein